MCHFHNSWLQNIHYNPQSSNKSTRASDLHIKIYAVDQWCVLRGLDKPDTGHWTLDTGHWTLDIFASSRSVTGAVLSPALTVPRC